MKYLLFILFVLSSTLSFSQDQKQIEENAYTFLSAFYTFDIQSAKPLGTNDTKEFITMIQGMLDQNLIPDTIMIVIRSTKIDIQSENIIVDAVNAIVPYILTSPKETGIPPMNKSLNMILQNDTWLASYTMEDAMREQQDAAAQMQEEKMQEEKPYIIKEETDVIIDEDYDGPSIEMPKKNPVTE